MIEILNGIIFNLDVKLAIMQEKLNIWFVVSYSVELCTVRDAVRLMEALDHKVTAHNDAVVTHCPAYHYVSEEPKTQRAHPIKPHSPLPLQWNTTKLSPERSEANLVARTFYNLPGAGVGWYRCSFFGDCNVPLAGYLRHSGTSPFWYAEIA